MLNRDVYTIVRATNSTLSLLQSDVSTKMNASPTTPIPPPTSEDIIFYTFNIGLICLISTVNIIGNTLVIQSVLRHKSLNVPGNYFIVSLACSDLVMGIIYPFYNVSHMEISNVLDVLGVWGSCSVLTTITLAALYWSSYNLVGITVTRYVCIQNPLTVSSKLTPCRTLAAVTVVGATCWCTSMMLHLRLNPPGHYPSNPICRYELVFEVDHIIFNTIFACIIPVSVMGVLYGHMAVIATSKIETMEMLRWSVLRANEGHARRIWLLKKEMRLFGVAGILIGYFTLAWAPYIAFEFVSIIKGDDLDRYIRATVRILLHSNTAVNVIIYAGRLFDFRSAIQQDVYKCFPLCFKKKPRHLFIVDHSLQFSSGSPC